jgi:predicted ATP-grasp superfamily ATP-dependent carboligase
MAVSVHPAPAPARVVGPILVGFAGALAAPEAAASLLDAGLPVTVFAERGTRPALRRDPRVTIEAITAPTKDAGAAISELVELARRCGAVAVMPLDDASLWLCDAAVPALGLPIIGPTGERARLALDKGVQVTSARAAGFAVPETRICTTRGELLALDRFPVVLKPALAIAEHDGRLSRGSIRVCASAAELAAAVATWNGVGALLAQPWLRGVGEGISGIAVDGRIVHPSAHRRLRMVNPQGSGSSACVSVAADPGVVEAAGRLLRDCKWSGLFMIELLRDESGTAWFMELNGRAWGSMALARRLGLEYPAWAALAALGMAPPPASNRAARDEPLVCRHLGREIVHLMAVLRGPRSAALADWPSRWGTLRAVARVRRSECWYNWSARRPGVFLHDTLQTALEPILKRVRR